MSTGAPISAKLLHCYSKFDCNNSYSIGAVDIGSEIYGANPITPQNNNQKDKKIRMPDDYYRRYIRCGVATEN